MGSAALGVACAITQLRRPEFPAKYKEVFKKERKKECMSKETVGNSWAVLNAILGDVTKYPQHHSNRVISSE